MGLRSDTDDVREQIHRDYLSLLATDVRVTVQKAKLLLADFLLEQKFNRMMRAVKANFNPRSHGCQLAIPMEGNGQLDNRPTETRISQREVELS